MNDHSFFSIDRLVEFGMSMAIAQQMIQTMNQSMQQMHISGSIQPIPISQIQPIFVVINNQSVGPLAESDFARLIADKQITKNTLAWMPGMISWKSIEQIPAILKIVALTPPPIPTNA